MEFIDRVAAATVQRYLSAFPAVAITGPRQSGKSTLLQHLLPDYQYVTFDDFRNVDFFNEDPIAFMEQYDNQVIFDEVQFVPDIFHHIKIAVDADRDNYGKFVLTGSSQFSYLKSAAESLAGRMGLFTLLPLQYKEVTTHLQQESIYRGAYPELVKRDYANSDLWYASYIDTYLQKDISALINIGDLRDFRRLIQLLAANVSSLLDYTSYAKQIGVSVPTIKRWISVLEASYILFLLTPYAKNLGKRLVKTPKVYFYDTGLVSFLTGTHTFDQYDKGLMAGAIFENYIIAEVLKLKSHRASNEDLYFLRSSDKKEVDLIIDRQGTQAFIEIKKSKTFKPAYLTMTELFMGVNDTAYLLYNGESLKYKTNVLVQNYGEFLGTC